MLPVSEYQIIRWTDRRKETTMSDIFRVKIVAKRQVTLPQMLLEKLSLSVGDEIEVEVDNGSVLAVTPLKLVPARVFTDELVKKVLRRAERMDAGATARPTVRGRGAAREEPAAASDARHQRA